AQLAARIGASPVGPFGVVGLGCTVEPVSLEDLAARVAGAVGRSPLVLRGGDHGVKRLAVSTGAAGHDLVQAAHEGYDALLEVERWPEFAPPGLQVVGASEVTRIVCGVSASRALLEQAVELGAELVLVHHGLFWRNEPLVVDARLRGRLEALFRGDASLVAYHLALDAHAELGNAAQLARRLGLVPGGPFGPFGVGCDQPPSTLDDLVARVAAQTERAPLVLAHGPEEVRRVAVATGAAGYDLVRAAHEGFDVLLTGEPEEPNLHAAQELGIHLIAAGHHATERYGVQALAAALANRFDLDWSYVEVPNPV
ncbi:MAG: Nif3-like dinuclear metal center hexameric protein, partial [Gaiella sp.]